MCAPNGAVAERERDWTGRQVVDWGWFHGNLKQWVVMMMAKMAAEERGRRKSVKLRETCVRVAIFCLCFMMFWNGKWKKEIRWSNDDDHLSFTQTMDFRTPKTMTRWGQKITKNLCRKLLENFCKCFDSKVKKSFRKQKLFSKSRVFYENLL